MGALTTLLALAIANVSGYCLYHSAQSIPKLQRYEQKAEKAAEWSNVAEKRLWDTRYTVGAGFLMTTISLLTAFSHIIFTWRSFGTVAWTAALAAGELGVSGYMKGFWSNKSKIPLPSMGDYNEAISDTERVMGLSDVLGVGWAVFAGLMLLRWLGLGV
ncbi:hypothetical protein V8F06_012585 [Rhypophila decipiens]